MVMKRYKSEEIVGLLRQADVLYRQGLSNSGSATSAIQLGSKADHALTWKPDQSMGAGQLGGGAIPMMSWGDLLYPGEWVIGRVGPVFQLFTNETFAPSLAAYLILLALALLTFYTIHVGLTWRRLEARRHVVASASTETMADDLAKIEKVMIQSITGPRNGFLHHAWDEFRETLIVPDVDDVSRVVWNTVRPQDFFNAHEAGLHFRFYRALPNIFVGVGLLLTFVGLVSALFFATQGIDQSATVEDTQKALQNLLHAATFKFYTSIAGLAASILFVVALRVGTRIIDGGFERLSAALEGRLEFVTREGLAFKQIALAEKQHEELQRLNTDIAIAIGQRVEAALNNTLPRHLEAALAPLSQRLESVSANLSDNNVDALGHLAESFSHQLTGAAQGQFEQLATVLSDLKSSLDGMKERMDESGSNLAENVRTSTDEMRTAIGAMTHALNEIVGKVQTGIEQSDAALERQVETLNDRLGHVADQLAQRLEDIGTGIMGRTNDATQQFAGQVAVAGQSFEKAAEATAGRIRDAVNDISRGAEAAGERAADAVRSSTEALQQALRAAAEEFGRVESQMASYRDTMRHVAESTSRAGNTIADASRHFQEASEPLAEVATDIAAASRETRATIQTAVEAIRSAQGQVQDVATVLRDTARTSGEAWAAYSRRFEGVDESLGKILEQMIGQVQAALDAIQRYVTEIDGAMSSSIDRLGGGIETLGEIAESLEKARGNGRDDGSQ